MTLNFTKHVDGGPVVGRTIPNVLGVQVIAHDKETEVRFWFEPSRICTVYVLRADESVTVDA